MKLASEKNRKSTQPQQTSNSQLDRISGIGSGIMGTRIIGSLDHGKPNLDNSPTTDDERRSTQNSQYCKTELKPRRTAKLIECVEYDHENERNVLDTPTSPFISYKQKSKYSGTKFQNHKLLSEQKHSFSNTKHSYSNYSNNEGKQESAKPQNRSILLRKTEAPSRVQQAGQEITLPTPLEQPKASRSSNGGRPQMPNGPDLNFNNYQMNSVFGSSSKKNSN